VGNSTAGVRPNSRPGMAFVEFLEQVELRALFLEARDGVADMFDKFIEVRVPGVQVGPLVDPGQEGALPVLGFLDGPL
jgi:hypothetical protein